MMLRCALRFRAGFRNPTRSLQVFATASPQRLGSTTKQQNADSGKSKKSTRNKLHNFHLENTLLFGKLLETSKERQKALKLNPPSAKVKKILAKSVEKNTEDALESTIVKIKLDDNSLVEKPVKFSKSKTDSQIARAVIRDNVLATGEQAHEDVPEPKATVESDARWVPIQLPLANPIRLSHHTDPDAPRYPSVTRILSATIPPEQKAILERWEKNKIKELGEAGFRNYKQELFINGREFHKNVEEILLGTSEDLLNIRDGIKPMWKSVRHILANLQNVQVLESYVNHPELQYCGVVDCIATFRDTVVLIDWKTSEKSKPVVTNTYDTPLQVAAYIGAVNADPNYNVEIKEGLIVVAYKTGQISDTFHLTQHDVSNYWNQWTKRLEQYQIQMSQPKDDPNENVS